MSSSSHNPERIHCGAVALAKMSGLGWDAAGEPFRQYYLRCANAVADAFDAWDKALHADRVRLGQARVRKLGVQVGGRQRVSPEREAKARALLAQNVRYAEVRAATGLGNSAISRIKFAMLTEKSNAPAARANGAHNGAHRVQVPGPEAG